MTSTLAILVDECFELDDAIRHLEEQREKVRSAILEEMRAAQTAALQHPRGTVSAQAYASLVGATPSKVMPLVVERGWVDDALSVNGRALHRLAAHDPTAMRILQPWVQERITEGVVLRRAKR